MILKKSLHHCKQCYRLFSSKVAEKQTENLQPIISCRRKEFDFYNDKPYDKLEAIPLASKGWHHKKSKGDYFIVHYVPNDVEPDVGTFSETGLCRDVLDVLKRNGISKPTTIQARAIPVILSRRNTFLAAETGSGKTLAYLLPVINTMFRSETPRRFNSPSCVVLTPSRELAAQVHRVAENLLRHTPFKSALVVGGGIRRKMWNPSFSVTDLLVATPGAVSKLLTVGVYKTDKTRHVVLDEADTLLDSSFSDKIGSILRRFGFVDDSGVQVTLASATLPHSLPENVNIPESLTQVTTDNIHRILSNVPQRFLRIGASMKRVQLLSLVRGNVAKRQPVMIFSNTSETCDWVSMFLNENGVKCVNLNGDMDLLIRKNVFERFQRGQIDAISCTDVGSRGLDTIRVRQLRHYKLH